MKDLTNDGAFFLFMNYLYTGSKIGIDADFNSVLDCLYICAQFNVSTLFNEAENYLLSHIDKSNCSSILAIVNQFSDSSTITISNLKDKSINYIMENFGEVINSQAFLNLPKELMAEIFRKAHSRGVRLNNNNNSEYIIFKIPVRGCCFRSKQLGRTLLLSDLHFGKQVQILLH